MIGSMLSKPISLRWSAIFFIHIAILDAAFENTAETCSPEGTYDRQLHLCTTSAWVARFLHAKLGPSLSQLSLTSLTNRQSPRTCHLTSQSKRRPGGNLQMNSAPSCSSHHDVRVKFFSFWPECCLVPTGVTLCIKSCSSQTFFFRPDKSSLYMTQFNFCQHKSTQRSWSASLDFSSSIGCQKRLWLLNNAQLLLLRPSAYVRR